MAAKDPILGESPSNLPIYRTLNSDLQEIRLVVVHPSPNFDSKIECHLIHTTLTSGTEYEALSYTWGKPDFTQPILLGGALFRVTTNLEGALKYLRLTGKERILWVDALCIDQQNTDERNEQVGYMSEIYRCCAVDLLWLGGDGSGRVDIERAMKVMTLLAAGNVPALGWESSFETNKLGLRMEGEERDQRVWTIHRNDVSDLDRLRSFLNSFQSQYGVFIHTIPKSWLPGASFTWFKKHPSGKRT